MYFAFAPEIPKEEWDEKFKSLRAAGFLFTAVCGDGEWQNMHKWCKNEFDDYRWTGSYFHFLTEDDAIRFKLVWG